MSTPIQLILASQSPRRKELLQMANISFEIAISHTDEHFPPELPTKEIPIYIAQQKAIAVQKKLGSIDIPILAADTIVTIDGEILGKPKNEQTAQSYLQKLSGRTHDVITGVVILYPDGKEKAFSETTRVTFYTLTLQQIKYYIEHYKPFDKAGAYGIQEWIGVVGIQSIEGDYYNVVGLPVSRILQEL